MKLKKITFSAILLVFMFFFLFTDNQTSLQAKEGETNPKITKASNENWNNILENIDIELKYLEPNKYLGLYWDSFVNGNPKDGYLYLCWTSPYFTKTHNTILQFTESNKTYPLYSTVEDMKNNRGNWLPSTSKQYPNDDLTLYMTPIGGIKEGQNFGIPLKRTYQFTNLKYGYESTNQSIGQITQKLDFDLGLVPKNDGKNSMQLSTHGYEIIKNCEAQSSFDLLKYGGYGHFVHFNTTLKIDKIYRVDVAYKVVNDDKPWYQWFLPSDEHQIKKSLTAQRVSGGIFGLYKFQGFFEGSYQSTKNSSLHYQYRLHLNYDDDAWNLLEGKGFYECDYRRISQFQILRMNYVVDKETFDVPIKMDTIEGDTLFILDPDLILDTKTDYYHFKKSMDDFISQIGEKWNKYQDIIVLVAGCIGGILILSLILRFYKFIKKIIGPKKE